MYIVLEGIDTAGKTTQIELLSQKLPQSYITKEPGGTDIGKKIREIILFESTQNSLTEFFLFLADRSEHTQQVLKRNKTVISDRSLISGIAYAMQNSTLSLEKMIELNLLAVNNILPDKVILFQLDKNTLIERLSKKSHDKIEERGVDYLLSIQDNLKKVVEKLEIEYLTIDASLPINKIHKEIYDFITALS